jgi:hypothetical protein
MERASVVNAANPGGLRPGFAMSFFAVFGAAMFIAYAALMALNGHAVRSSGSLEQGPTGLVFSDRHEGIELTVPQDWSPFRSEDTLVSLRADGMRLILEEQYATYPVDTMLSLTEKDVQHRHPSAAFTPVAIKLDRRFASGFDSSYVNDAQIPLNQRVLGLRRGNNILILIETWTRSKDRATFDPIEQNIRF